MQFARLLSDTAAIKKYWIAGAKRKMKSDHKFRRIRSTFVVLRPSRWFLVVSSYKYNILIFVYSKNWNNGGKWWRFFAIIGLKGTEELKMEDPVSSADAKLLKNLGGVGLVMTIIFTISVRTTSIVHICICLIFQRIALPNFKKWITMSQIWLSI